jgi:hypothetical protein
MKIIRKYMAFGAEDKFFKKFIAKLKIKKG